MMEILVEKLLLLRYFKEAKRKEGGGKKQKEKNRRTKTGKQWRAMERIHGNKLGN